MQQFTLIAASCETLRDLMFLRTQDATPDVGRRFLNPSGTPVLVGLFCFYVRSLSFDTGSLLTLIRSSVLHPRTQQQMLGGGGRGTTPA
jgi:hypothetical protein